ncbi:MAG: hypothetical protein PSX36_10725 [bacterium]|nr:hypothetical protein [bacterium]
MKLLILISWLSLFSAPDAEVLTYRRMLYASEKSATMATSFYTITRSLTNESAAVKRGYKAMSCFMMSKHVTGPLSKISYFKEGRKELEEAIALSPDNMELRFLRFSTQSNTPNFLGYKNSMADDKARILKQLKSGVQAGDQDLYDKIYTFMLNSEYCSAEEKKLIHLN